jgi:hypothetical protein
MRNPQESYPLLSRKLKGLTLCLRVSMVNLVSFV